jgi:ribosomal protein L31
MREAEIRIVVPGHPRPKNKNSLDPISTTTKTKTKQKKKNLAVVVHACHPNYGGKYKIGGSRSKPAWAKK